jgi:glycine hydroxymethyltransferase
MTQHAETRTAAPMLRRYLDTVGLDRMDPAAVAFYAGIDATAATSPGIAEAVLRELADQRANIKLIASENFSSLPVQLAQGTLFTDKYAEGFPGHRFYAGCDNVDAVESEAADLATQLFGADHAYVQPHSGADANLVAFLAILSHTVESPALARLELTDPSKVPAAEWEQIRRELGNQRMLGMDYYSGGHLTHGYRHNVSSRLFEAFGYTVDRETALLDFDAISAQARELRPRILLAGYSAYSREIDFARFRELADEIGATFMVDMAHFAGLVAGKVFTGNANPIPYAHVVTTTTHKTLRGPRGGMVLSTSEYAPAVDKGCPMVLGGPLPHIMAAKAVAFAEARQPAFAQYAQAVADNAVALADGLLRRGATLVTGGTENHIVLLDVTSFAITGRQAESALVDAGIVTNRNAVPRDPNGAWYTSGIRLGTPALTTRGFGTDDMDRVADLIVDVLTATEAAAARDGAPSKAKYELSDEVAKRTQAAAAELLGAHPLYPGLDLG